MQSYRRTLQATEIHKLIGNSPTMLEIGCHEGTDTAEFLIAMPDIRLYCFDPELRATARFENRLGDDPRVTLHKAAVSDVDGTRYFHASTGKAGHSDDWDYSGSLHTPTGHLTRSPEIKFKDPALVPCLRLDTWLTQTPNVTQIDFVWADVQGSQRVVISGANRTLSITRYLYIEAHDPVAYANEPTQEELIDELADYHFVPLAIYAKENILFERKERDTV